jgi:hypothetical protein
MNLPQTAGIILLITSANTILIVSLNSLFFWAFHRSRSSSTAENYPPFQIDACEDLKKGIKALLSGGIFYEEQ